MFVLYCPTHLSSYDLNIFLESERFITVVVQFLPIRVSIPNDFFDRHRKPGMLSVISRLRSKNTQ